LKTKKKQTTKYLHGYTKSEQGRLLKQASFLEEKVFDGIQFSKKHLKIIEVGSGVGAQTAILLKRFPHLNISCVDRSQEQLIAAQRNLKKLQKKLKFFHADATALPFSKNEFDGAFVCWFLEHVSDVQGALKELKRVLNPGASVFISEVLNSTLHIDPPSPTIMKYWKKFNDHQLKIKGNPYVGLSLGNYLKETGFLEVQLNSKIFHLDSRDVTLKNKTLQYFEELLFSASDALTKVSKTSPKELAKLKNEFNVLRKNSKSVFYFAFIQAHAKA